MLNSERERGPVSGNEAITAMHNRNILQNIQQKT